MCMVDPHAASIIPRPSLPPVFDHLQYWNRSKTAAWGFDCMRQGVYNINGFYTLIAGLNYQENSRDHTVQTVTPDFFLKIVVSLY